MKRPVAVTVFGILHIVFAAFGVFGVVATAALLFVSRAAVGNDPVLKDNPALKAINNNRLRNVDQGFHPAQLGEVPYSTAGRHRPAAVRNGAQALARLRRFCDAITMADMIVSYVFLIGPLLGPSTAKRAGKCRSDRSTSAA